MGDEHDDPVFESADAGASHTYPMQAGTTRFFSRVYSFFLLLEAQIKNFVRVMRQCFDDPWGMMTQTY